MHLVLKFWLWGRFVAEKQTFVLNLMAGHLLNMTYNENGKWNVWELDHYIDRSSLGIHFWDLYWKMAYLKFEKFWYANVRPWETVQIWGYCPCSKISYQGYSIYFIAHWNILDMCNVYALFTLKGVVSQQVKLFLCKYRFCLAQPKSAVDKESTFLIWSLKSPMKY